MKLDAAKHYLREERGFTLPEMLVTIMVMILVLFALYSVFDMSIRVFGYGNDKVEAVENARLGLEKMERELRAAYPVDNTDTTDPDSRPTAPHLFFNVASPTTPNVPTTAVTELTFGNDLNGDKKLSCPIAPPADTRCEYITYSVDGGTRTLMRTSGGAPQPVVEYVDYVNSADTGLRFTPLTENLTTPASASQVRVMRIDLSIRIQEGDRDVEQTLTTNVTLRNPGS